MVLNGDSLVLADMTNFTATLMANDWDAAVVGLQMEDTSRYGTLRLGKGNLIEAFAEKQSGAGLINAGGYLFSQKVLAQFASNRPLSFGTEVFAHFLGKGVRI